MIAEKDNGTFNTDEEMERVVKGIRPYLDSIKKYMGESNRILTERQLLGAGSLVNLAQRIYLRDLETAMEKGKIDGDSYRNARLSTLSSFGPFQSLRDEMRKHYAECLVLSPAAS